MSLNAIIEGLRALVDDSSYGSNSFPYTCTNSTFVDNSSCSEDDPYCNCPCLDEDDMIELRPSKIAEEHWAWLIDDDRLDGWTWREDVEDKSAEPTEGEISEAYNETKECELIEEVLGEEYLGCLWKDHKHPSSCICPCVGEKFKEYIEYSRTDATYWDTPKVTPLWRNAQMQLINSQKMSIVLNGDLTLRPGVPITIANVTPGDEKSDKRKKITGRWLVSDIEHIISSDSHKMNLILTRDSTTIDPNESEGLLSSLLKFFGL